MSITTMSGKKKIKIVFLGNQGVGKSCIIQKYIHNKFDESSNPTVGIDFLAKNVSHNAKNYRLQLWDTAGQQRFRSLIPSYLKDANCALIIYDVTDELSLSCMQNWYNLYKDNKIGQDGFVILVGNKIDLEDRVVSEEQGKKKAEQLGIDYFQISAKTGHNIQKLFSKLLDIAQGGQTYKASTENAKQKQKQSPIKQQKQQEIQANHVDATTSAIIQDKSNPKNKNIVLNNVELNKQQKKKGGCC